MVEPVDRRLNFGRIGVLLLEGASQLGIGGAHLRLERLALGLMLTLDPGDTRLLFAAEVELLVHQFVERGGLLHSMHDKLRTAPNADGGDQHRHHERQQHAAHQAHSRPSSSVEGARFAAMEKAP